VRKNSTQNASKVSIGDLNSKNMGREHRSLSRPFPSVEGDTPSHTIALLGDFSAPVLTPAALELKCSVTKHFAPSNVRCQLM